MTSIDSLLFLRCFSPNKIGILEPNRKIIWRQQTGCETTHAHTPNCCKENIYIQKLLNWREWKKNWNGNQANISKSVLQLIRQLNKQSILERVRKEEYKFHRVYWIVNVWIILIFSYSLLNEFNLWISMKAVTRWRHWNHNLYILFTTIQLLVCVKQFEIY